jgi:hypothetical protein
MSPRLPGSLLAIVALAGPASLSAATVWATGAPGITAVTFTKPASADPFVANDPITSLVVLSRGDEQGLFNIVTETVHILDLSPAGTEWAFAELNGNPATIGAADFASLTFTDWRNALGGRGSLLSNIENRPGVVHLLDEDIYLDLTFTDFGGPGSGGRFTYIRTAGPIPEPSAQALLGVAALALARRRRRL